MNRIKDRGSIVLKKRTIKNAINVRKWINSIGNVLIEYVRLRQTQKMVKLESTHPKIGIKNMVNQNFTSMEVENFVIFMLM